MARVTKVAAPMPVMAEQPLEVDCIPCLEDMGLWKFAQKIRAGEHVYQYDIDMAMQEGYHGYPENQVWPGAIGPIRDSMGVTSLGSMMSEGCPPNTGRHYEEV